MTTPAIPGFTQQRVDVTDGVALNVATGGSGSPIVLLHGFPQTHLMWRHVAVDLAAEHTVICPDLRGYGASDKPADVDGQVYSKRTMAADVVAVARALGHERFALVGHDRGALVAIRAGLDHPETVTHLASLDVLTNLDTWGVLQGLSASVAWHLYFMAQPAGLPEAMISGAADEFFGSFLDAWANDPAAMPDDVRAEYLRASREAIPSIVADYRASAHVDVEHDRGDLEAGVRLRMPVTVLQQDWGPELSSGAAAMWGAWATDLDHRTVSSGHFMAEEAPGEVIGAVRDLLAR
jgi:haloacetate dehalogenase